MTSPVFSPDGKTVALDWPDKTIRLWDSATGRERQRLSGHEGAVTQLAFSPDGELLASAGRDKTVRLWDLATGKERRQFRDEGTAWETIPFAFSGDGKKLITMSQKARALRMKCWTSSVWDIATAKDPVRQTFEVEHEFGHALSPDGKHFAVISADTKSIRLFDPATGKELCRTEGDASRLGDIAFSADGRAMTAAAYRDGTVRVWDVDTGKLRHHFKALPGGIVAPTLSRDGALVALNGLEAGACLHIYDVARGKEIHDFPGHRDGPLTVAFARDGKTVITVERATVRTQPVESWANWSFRVWEAATGKELRVTQADPKGEIRLVVVSPDARLIATVIHDGTIRLWEISTGKEFQHWKGPTWEVKWQVGKEWKTADYTAVQQAAFSPDGKIFVAPGRKGRIDRWDTTTGKELPPLKTPLPVAPNSFPIFPSLSSSADGRTLLASAYDLNGYPEYSLLLLDAASGRLVRMIDTRRDTTGKSLIASPIQEAVSSPDGRTWAVKGQTDAPAVVLFEAATGRQRGVLEARDGVTALAFSPDGRWLVIGSHQLSLWDLATGRIVAHAAGPCSSLAFSPDGKRLAVGSGDSAALVYDVAELLKKAPAPEKLTAADRDRLWKDLSGADAARAYQAIQRLAADPESVPFLKERLQEPPKPEQKRLARLLADLDSEDFDVREKATQELEQLGHQAEPALREVLEGMPGAEVRTRVEGLLKKLNGEGGALPSARVIALRALEALEIAGTVEARRVIKSLAEGSADAHLTQEAKTALERVAARAGSAP
jgi:WD40 repeat protein